MKILKKSGFTLIELMVVVVIMLLMTSVIFFNYNNFNDSMLLTNSAYDVSLTVRQAQVYGTAVKEGTSGSVATQIDPNSYSNFAFAYGVHFDDSTADNISGFALFVDTTGATGDPDGIFQSNEALQTYTFQRGIKIEKMCVNAGTGDCNAPGATIVKTLDITFLRPNPEAQIYAVDANGFAVCGLSAGVSCGSATIDLENAEDSIAKAIVVSSTGQISVQAAPNPTP